MKPVKRSFAIEPEELDCLLKSEGKLPAILIAFLKIHLEPMLVGGIELKIREKPILPEEVSDWVEFDYSDMDQKTPSYRVKNSLPDGSKPNSTDPYDELPPRVLSQLHDYLHKWSLWVHEFNEARARKVDQAKKDETVIRQYYLQPALELLQLGGEAFLTILHEMIDGKIEIHPPMDLYLETLSSIDDLDISGIDMNRIGDYERSARFCHTCLLNAQSTNVGNPSLLDGVLMNGKPLDRNDISSLRKFIEWLRVLEKWRDIDKKWLNGIASSSGLDYLQLSRFVSKLANWSFYLSSNIKT